MPDQTFLRPSGEPIEWLQFDEASGMPKVPPDTFSALRLLMAAIDHDYDTIGAILRERPAVPLLTGVGTLACSFGGLLYGDNFRMILDQLALDPALDPVGAADDYRDRRTA